LQPSGLVTLDDQQTCPGTWSGVAVRHESNAASFQARWTSLARCPDRSSTSSSAPGHASASASSGGPREGGAVPPGRVRQLPAVGADDVVVPGNLAEALPRLGEEAAGAAVQPVDLRSARGADRADHDLGHPVREGLGVHQRERRAPRATRVRQAPAAAALVEQHDAVPGRVEHPPHAGRAALAGAAVHTTAGLPSGFPQVSQYTRCPSPTSSSPWA
jgi:hypothetical protein